MDNIYQIVNSNYNKRLLNLSCDPFVWSNIIHVTCMDYSNGSEKESWISKFTMDSFGSIEEVLKFNTKFVEENVAL